MGENLSKYLFLMICSGILFCVVNIISVLSLVSYLNFVFIGLFVAFLLLILYYSIRIKRITRKVEDQDKTIHELDSELRKSKSELTIPHEIISKDNYSPDQFYEILVQSANDGVSFYDRDWKLKYANPAFYSMAGLNKDNYPYPDSDVLIHPDDKDYEERRINALTSNGFHESELRIRHLDGHFVNLSTRSIVVRNDSGEVLGSLTISRDITKLKQVHEELIKAKFEAEASNRLKSSFLANISHEIRTPLNSVVGFSNLLLANGLSNETKAEYIENINHNSEKLLQIIGDIIDLSRLESSQIEITYEEASLSRIINEIIEEARKDIKRNEKSIYLSFKNNFEDNSDLIFTDRIWLKRVLTHLMDNAIKFTLDGSVEFSYLKENENIVFKITDTGIGINKENLSRIFEEFSQEIDGHHRPFEGLGIGLTLAKEVVERMGGKIYVKSEKGVGSEFSFSIPYRPAGSFKAKISALINSEMVTGINWSSRKCLVVDDNKDVLIYLSRILFDTGIKIITARSGFEAIEHLKSTPDIDLVLLDMQMPEMNGIETTAEIRRIRHNLPIIAQTAFIFNDDKDIILEAGCDACLIKPIRKEHLLSVMSNFLKSS